MQDRKEILKVKEEEEGLEFRKAKPADAISYITQISENPNPRSISKISQKSFVLGGLSGSVWGQCGLPPWGRVV